MSLHVRASRIFNKMDPNTKSHSKTVINKSPHPGWRTPTVALKTTEKSIYTPAPPVLTYPPSVNVTFNSGEVSGEEC
jgi:hypothetical protein